MYFFIIEGQTLEIGEKIITKTNRFQLGQFFRIIQDQSSPSFSFITGANRYHYSCCKTFRMDLYEDQTAFCNRRNDCGIVLGPSLVGMYFPEFSAFLFPKESLGNLQFLSQIGLILFMYIVGMELDLSVLRKKHMMLW
jgi:hypothetical protein